MHQNTSCTLCLVYLLKGQFVSFFFSMFKHVFIAQPNMSRQLLFVYDSVEIWYKSLAVWLAWILNSKPLANIVIGSSHQDLSYLQRNTGCFSYSTTCSHMKISNIKKKLNTQEHFFFHWRITPSITNNIDLSFCFLMKIHFIYSFNCLANLMPPRKFNCPHSVIGAEKNNHLLFSTYIWTFEQVC